MSMHIIIDGYNLIRQSRFFSPLDSQDIQLGREALIDTLAAYKKVKGHKITVVFDGARAPFFAGSRDQIKGIKIKFSGNGESADTVIKRMAAGEKEKALIVSSDLDVMNFASAKGCATITSLRFEEKLTAASYTDTKGIDRENEGGRIPNEKERPQPAAFQKKAQKQN